MAIISPVAGVAVGPKRHTTATGNFEDIVHIDWSFGNEVTTIVRDDRSPHGGGGSLLHTLETLGDLMNVTTKLTVKQAAVRFGLSASLLYLMCQERRLPHYRVGGRGKRGRLLIEAADLESFLKAQRVEPAPPKQDGLRFIKT